MLPYLARAEKEEDDQWVVPHNLCLAVYSPSSVNVLAFDPNHGSDQARNYAGKYASKPERYFFMESEKNGVKCWLKARTVGLCAAFNRLLNFHCVRSTKPVMFPPSEFVRDAAHSPLRSEGHLKKFPEYPDPKFHLSPLGIYYFRSRALLHLRVEQFNRYFVAADRADNADAYCGCGIESPDDDDPEDVSRFVEVDHRHYDEFCEIQKPGKTYAARFKGVPSAKRRLHARLGVARTQWFEPIGTTREKFYEQKLALGLPWFADSAPQVVETGAQQAVAWVLKWARPQSLAAYDLLEIALEISSAGSRFSFEERCHHYESVFSSSTLNIVCRCCDGEIDQGPCDACLYAVGFHVCKKSGSQHRWRRTTLFGGQLDVQRTIFNLHRRSFPMDVIRSKSQEYIDAGLISEQMAQAMVRTHACPDVMAGRPVLPCRHAAGGRRGVHEDHRERARW